MRTLAEIISGAKRARVTQLTEAQLTEMINRAENMVQTKLLLLPRQSCIEYDYEDDRDEELLLSDSFSELYLYYLMREIDLHHGETNLYENDGAAFDEAWADAKHYVCTAVRPAYGGMLPNQPSVQTIFRGNTETIQFQRLPLTPTVAAAVFTQGGEVLLELTEEDEELTIEEDAVAISLGAAETSLFKAGIAKLKLSIGNEDEDYSNWPVARLRVKEGK